MTDDGFKTALEALGDSLAVADTVIYDQRFGVETDVPLVSGYADPVLAYGYTVRGERRRLHVLRAGAVEEIADLRIPEREQAAEAIPRLVDALRAKRAGMGEQIQAAADRLETYLDSLEGEAG